jgi:hypothetical protein
MHFAPVIQSRKGWAWAVLIALAIVGILIAAQWFCCQANHQNHFKWTTSMACWIKRLPDVGTDEPL